MLRVVLVIALVVGSSRATADPATADKLAAEAAERFKEGKFREAAALFTRATKEDPARSDLFCNIGIAYYKANEVARAHLILNRCLVEQSALEAGFVTSAKAALESVEGSLRAAGHTPVEVTVTPPGASVGIVEFELDQAFVGRRVVWLPFGTHHLTVRAEGYQDQTVEVVTTTKEPKAVRVDLARPTAGGGAKLPPLPPTQAPRRASKLPAILVTAGTVGGFVIAGIAFSKARAAADRAGTALDDDTHAADKTEVDRWNTTFGIAGSLGIVGAVASGYLWYRATRTPAVEITPTASGATVTLRGRF